MAVVPFTRYFKPSIQIDVGSQPVTVMNSKGTGLRMRFRISKSITSSANTAKVDVFNMDGVRISSIASQVAVTGKSPISISIGYDDIVGRVFSGDIKRLDSRIVAPPEIITRIEADDAGDAIDEVALSITAPAASVQQLVDITLAAFRELAQKEIQISNSAQELIDAFRNKDRPFPIAHVGKASDLLDEAARILEARWWIDDGLLYMAKRGLPIDGLAVELDTSKLFSDIAQDRGGFVRFSTFCDPNIVPGRQVLVNNSVYRVHMVEYIGDTFGGSPWVANVTAWDSVL